MILYSQMREGFGVGALSEMRITINYFEGYPELQADLSAFPCAPEPNGCGCLPRMACLL